MVKQLGSEGFSTVWLAERINGPAVSKAIKVVRKQNISTEKINLLKKEFSILKTVNHPQVAGFREFYEDNLNFYIVSDLWNGTSLLEILTNGKMGEFTEEDVMNIMF